jgi:hypothetical protein
MTAADASDPDEPLRFWRRLALGLALAVLLLGIAGGVSGWGLFTAFALDGYAALVWGVLYGVLALMVGRRYKRVLIAVAGLLLVDGTRLVIMAGDAGQGWPWLALLVRAGLAILLVRAAFAASEAAADRRRRRPTVARVPPGRSPARPSPQAAARQRPPEQTPPAAGPMPGVRAPRTTGSVLTTGSRSAGVSLRGPQASVDAAADSLRFVVRRCEAREDGLSVTPMKGSEQNIPWDRMSRLWIRALPPDAPWDGQIVLDLVLEGGEKPVDPVRVFSTTLVPPPPGAPAASRSRADVVRGLARHVVEHAPNVGMDAETRAFVEESRPPERLLTLDELVAQEETYGSPRRR